MWQEPHAAQPAQLPPQEDFPCFLSRIILRIIRATTARRTRLIRIVPIFALIHCSIKITPFQNIEAWSQTYRLAPKRSDFRKLGGFLVGLEQHVQHTSQSSQSEDQADHADVSEEQVAELVDHQSDDVSEAALIADCKPSPLVVVHLTLDCADSREAGSAKKVEYEERICADAGEYTCESVINIAVAVLIYTGALRVDSGSISRGDVVALYNYMSQILIELVKLAGLIISITKSIACANRVQAVLDTEPGTVSGKAVSAGDSEFDVEFDHASLSYGGAEEALHDINLKIKRGSNVGIIGSTGSGKSTLVNLIPRFYDVSGGRILIDGVDIKNMSMRTLHEKIGFIPQSAFLFSGTVADNLRMGKPDATEEEMWEALETAQAADFVKAMPDGLDSELSQNGKNLSGGQRQRLAIARVLIRKAEIYVFDDSFSALDFSTDAKLRRALREKMPNITKIIVAQRVGTIIDANRIIVLDEGKVAGIGTHRELLETCAVYREIAQSQLSKEELA